MSTLTFAQLRTANLARVKHFLTRNPQGLLVALGTVDAWTPAQWLQALVGEIGEYANIRKKYERGDITFQEFQEKAKKELGDVQCYLDLLAESIRIDLGQATMDKWNEVSKRIGYRGRLT